MRYASANQFSLPVGLTRLIEAGVWPSTSRPATIAQRLTPAISRDRVKQFAAEEELICLAPAPFLTIARSHALSRSGDFWERCGALHQIDPEQSLIIGDFGLGTDAPIVLEYSRDSSNPPVLRLRWNLEGEVTQWVQGARDFDEFARILGLADQLE